MFKYKIEPRLSETDGLGHINNTVLPVWFEEARKDLFRIFNPSLEVKTWNLILKRFEVEIVNQINHTSPVTIITYIEKIGEKSLIVQQEASQDNIKVASGKTVLIHFDYSTNTASEIPKEIRDRLNKHLVQ